MEATGPSASRRRPHSIHFEGATGATRAAGAAIILLALALRLAISPSYGYMGYEADLIEQKQAMHRAITLGFHEIYTANSLNDPAITGGEWQGGYFINWPPVIVYLRYVPGLVYKTLHPREFELWNSEINYFQMLRSGLGARLASSRGFSIAAKLPCILADVLLAVGLFFYTLRRAGPKPALAATAALALSPGLILESAHWGQPDAVWALLLVLSLFLVQRGEVEFGLIAYALAGLTKPQPAAMFFLLLYLTLSTAPFRRAVVAGALALATGALVYAPFLLHGTFTESVSVMLQSIFGGEPFVASNANNLWWLIYGGRGYEVPDTIQVIGSLTPRNLGLIGFVSANAFAIWRLHGYRRWREDAPTVFLAASFIIMSFFSLNTELHENHMMAVVPLLAFSLPGDRRRWIPFALLSTTLLVNLALFDFSVLKGLHDLGIGPLPVVDLSIANAALNTLGYGAMGWLFWDATRPAADSTAAGASSATKDLSTQPL